LESEHPTEFSQAVSKKVNHHYALMQSDRSKEASLLLQLATHNMCTQTKFIGSFLTVLLAIDEAQFLLTPPKQSLNESSFFCNFFHALKPIPLHQCFFAIFTGTTSQVANLIPTPKHDPTRRDGMEPGDQLFDPIYHISMFDVLVSTNPPQSWKELMSATQLVNHGSPIFGTYRCNAKAKGMEPFKILDQILCLAQSKLLGSRKTPQPDQLTSYQALALLGPTIQPQLNG
jgi:hypothetical protein